MSQKSVDTTIIWMELLLKLYKRHFVQWIATLAVFMLSSQAGLFIGWASPNVALLSSEKSPIPTTPSAVSWMISFGSLGSALGAILGSTSIEYLGSKKTVFLTYLFMGVNWICVLSAKTMILLYIARFIGGVGFTMFGCCFSMYLGEVAAPKIRGTLISLSLSGNILGVILGLAAETYLQRDISCPIYLTIVLFGLLLLVYLKDTPYYLMKINDADNAKKSIEFYRGDCNVEKELDEIRSFVENSSESIGSKFRQLKLPTVRRSMLIIIVVFGLPEACGTANVLSYTEVILKSAGINYIKPEECVIYVNVVSISSMILIFPLVDKLGRKISLIISSVGTSIALVGLGIYFYLLNSGLDMKVYQWLPICLILGFLISYNFGYISVPSTLLSEMFPENMKSIAACLGTLSTSLFGFLATKSYEPIVRSVGEPYAFWTHAALSIAGVPFVLFLLTETKGKTFQEIQNKLYKK